MSQCPENPTINNCGLAAAQWLVANKLIVIDPLHSDVPIVGIAGAPAFQQLRGRGVHSEAGKDIADFGCLACGGCVQIVDDLGDFSVQRTS